MALRKLHMLVINFKAGVVCATDGYLRKYNEFSKCYAMLTDMAVLVQLRTVLAYNLFIGTKPKPTGCAYRTMFMLRLTLILKNISTGTLHLND